jgi:long-chain acyl-CoA synthetase
MSIPLNVERPWFVHYPPGVPKEIEIPDKRIPDLLRESAERWPNRDAFVFYGSRWSYRSFWLEAERFAAAIAREGLRAGDRLALYLPNCPAYTIAYLGALRLGVTIVQISPLYLGQDLRRLLADANPKGIVTLEIHYPNLNALSSEMVLPTTFVARLREFYPPLRRLFVNSVLRRRGLSTRVPVGPNIRLWHEALQTIGEVTDHRSDPATEIAVLQYTGGTTGVPKAAMLTHRNLIANALQCQAWFHASRPPREVVLASVPLFHIYGLTVVLNYPLFEGATLILELRPEVNEILKLINKHRPTEFPGVPALYQAILRHPKLGRYNIRSIKICLSGSAPLPVEVAKKFEELTGGYLVEGYGLTEASPVTHANPIEGERRMGSIGLPFPSTEQKIVDLETGTRTLGPGEAGELAVRGPQVMLGYYRQPDETAQVLRDRWLLTGDIATIDADGYAYIVDRKKDLIDVGGFKVWPREVEEVLYQHPGVADASVVGAPDPTLGEIVYAFVVAKEGVKTTEAELIQFVRHRIAHYKAPRRVEFRSELPRSGVQKVLRRVLRDSIRARDTETVTTPERSSLGR